MDLNHSFRFSFFDKEFPKEETVQRDSTLFNLFGDCSFYNKSWDRFLSIQVGERYFTFAKYFKGKGNCLWVKYGILVYS